MNKLKRGICVYKSLIRSFRHLLLNPVNRFSTQLNQNTCQANNSSKIQISFVKHTYMYFY